MVFSGLFPVNPDDFEALRSSLEKLHLNDSSLFFEPETSSALGFGFRCGFLGMLHMEIVQERMEREFGLRLITTVPNVRYEIHLSNGKIYQVANPSKMPSMGEINEIREPFIIAELITPVMYIGNIMKLCQEKRGIYKTTHYLDGEKVQLVYELPLSEVIFDFYDKLKSVSRGYASIDYDFLGFRKASLTRLDILINGEPVDALSVSVHKDRAYDRGRKLCQRLRSIIPRQLFEVIIQAVIGSRVIARETIKPLRKNVTAKCYGGDITRKRKLLERQKEGKKRMKQVGRIEVPQEAFLAVLQIDNKGR
jgi:GTP-binding protein LepA